jgi:hypothetical protein
VSSHGSQREAFRRAASRLAGPRELTPAEFARAWWRAYSGAVPHQETAWLDLPLPTRLLLERVAEELLDGPIAEHARARLAGAGDGRAGVSTPVAGVCREFVDVDVRDSILMLARSEPGEEITFSEAASRVAHALDALRTYRAAVEGRDD